MSINMRTYDTANVNCFDEFKDVKSNTFDLIVCDLNHGTLNKDNPDAQTFNSVFDNKELKKFCKAVIRIVKPSGTVIFFGKELFTVDVINCLREYYKYRYVWKKGNKVTNFLNASKAPLSNHEDILIFQKEETRKGKPKAKHTYNPQKTKGEKRYSSIINIGKEKHSNTYGKHKESLSEDTDMRYPTTILDFMLTAAEYKIPTQKPVDLLIHLIETYSNKGDVVLDPCMGSGTTGVACKICDRSFTGWEIDKERWQMAMGRISETPSIKTIDL